MDKQNKNYILVIESYDKENKRDIEIEVVETFLRAYCNFYAYILHDKDINKDTGELKRPHYHVYMTLQRRNRFTWVLNRLNEVNVPKHVVSILPSYSEHINLQYLLHLNDKDKHQYAIFEIVTNNNEHLSNILSDKELTVLTTQKLLQVIDDCNYSKIKILRVIGLGNYTRYFRVIDMVIENSGNPDKITRKEQ